VRPLKGPRSLCLSPAVFCLPVVFWALRRRIWASKGLFFGFRERDCLKWTLESGRLPVIVGIEKRSIRKKNGDRKSRKRTDFCRCSTGQNRRSRSKTAQNRNRAGKQVNIIEIYRTIPAAVLKSRPRLAPPRKGGFSFENTGPPDAGKPLRFGRQAWFGHLTAAVHGCDRKEGAA